MKRCSSFGLRFRRVFLGLHQHHFVRIVRSFMWGRFSFLTFTANGMPCLMHCFKLKPSSASRCTSRMKTIALLQIICQPWALLASTLSRGDLQLYSLQDAFPTTSWFATHALANGCTRNMYVIMVRLSGLWELSCQGARPTVRRRRRSFKRWRRRCSASSSLCGKPNPSTLNSKLSAAIFWIRSHFVLIL